MVPQLVLGRAPEKGFCLETKILIFLFNPCTIALITVSQDTYNIQNSNRTFKICTFAVVCNIRPFNLNPEK